MVSEQAAGTNVPSAKLKCDRWKNGNKIVIENWQKFL